MSWRVINDIIGLATINPDFCRAFLDNPTQAARAHGFTLTLEEEQVLNTIKVNDIYEFSQKLIEHFGNQGP